MKGTDTFNFINIAFYRKNKNQNILIKAFSKSFRNKENIKLTIVGSGPEYDNLNELILNLGMQKQIILYGEANREEVRELLQTSDAFILSSEYETFGVVVIEAMACGLPVISTKCGGPESIIQDDKVGILTEINEDSLSSALTFMYNNIENYDSKYIRKYVEDNFSEEAVYLQIQNIYKDVLHNRKRVISEL